MSEQVELYWGKFSGSADSSITSHLQPRKRGDAGSCAGRDALQSQDGSRFECEMKKVIHGWQDESHSDKVRNGVGYSHLNRVKFSNLSHRIQ